MKFGSVLVANRGEIAVRVMRTAKRMGLRTIGVYSDADRDAPHVRAADEAIHIGGAMSYLDVEAVLRAPGDAIHPGYGFLSENPGFAEAVQKSGRVWIGPPPAAMRAMGDKANAKAIAAKAGVPLLPTYAKDPEFPVMIKALAGGGGRGIRIVHSSEDLPGALETAQSEAQHAFGDSRVLLEKALLSPRHVEVQIFADAHGTCVHLGERDCSVQRRHQKLIEESPSPAVDARARAALGAAAVAVAKAVGYVGAGTVEFLQGEDGRFWFMEMNTRLQVEHPVTEALTGLDLVEWQLRIADGERLPLAQEQIRFSGHAIEARLCAEDPEKDHLPQTGRLARWRPAEGVRTDHALESGIEVSPHYDSLLAKVIAHAESREAARAKLADALQNTVALGLKTNRFFLSWVLRDRTFAAGKASTGFLRDFHMPGESATNRWLARALAAVLLCEARARAAGFDEWSGWSNNPDRVVTLDLALGSMREPAVLRRIEGGYAVKPALHHAQGPEYRMRVLQIQDDVATIAIDDGAPVEIPFCVEEDHVHLAYWHGKSWSFVDLTHEPRTRRAVAGSANQLSAPMNGRVVAVNAKAGERIEAGKPLVVLEAMKMEHGLELPFAIRVKAVHTKAGNQVAPGNLLVEFEPA